MLVAAWESREDPGPDESVLEFLVLEISSQVDPAFQHILGHAMNMVRRVVMLLGWVEVGSGRGGAYLKRVSSYLRSYSWLARLICIVFVKSHARTVKSNLNEVFHQSVILLSKSFIFSIAVWDVISGTLIRRKEWKYFSSTKKRRKSNATWSTWIIALCVIAISNYCNTV